MRSIINKLCFLTFIFIILLSLPGCDNLFGDDTENLEDPHEHVYGDWELEFEPTCIDEGIEKRVCEVCGYFETRIVEPTGVHKIENNICLGCGLIEDADEFLSFTELNDGTYSVSLKRGVNCPKKLIIPSESKGRIITKIKDNGFENHINLTSITIPDSVTMIGISAFSGCENLSIINFGIGLEVIDNYAFANCKSIIKLVLPESIKTIEVRAFINCDIEYLEIHDNIEKIDNAAFFNCRNIKAAVLPSIATSALADSHSTLESVTITSGEEISNSAFSGCRNLKNVTISDSITKIGAQAFSKCESLESVPLTKNITFIGKKAFESCTGFTTVSIPESVTTIENSAFNGCINLKNVYIENIESWLKVCSLNNETYLFEYGELHFIDKNKNEITDIVIPEGTKVIGDYAFSNCINLKSVKLSNGVEIIGNKAFYNCVNLNSVNLTNSVTEIEDYAFSNCNNLSEVNLNEGLITISDFAFSSCTALKSITLPNSLEIIGHASFQNCISLEDVYIYNIQNWINSFNDSTINYLNYYANIHILDDNQNEITKLVIPSDTKEIKKEMFKNFVDIEEAILPTDVTNIGNYAFSNCINLNKITLPEKLEIIGRGAFKGCISISEITIPNSVSLIDVLAFEGCDNLKCAYISNVEAWNEIHKSNRVFKNIEELHILDEDGTEVTELAISDTVSEINNYTFANCVNVKKLIIPDTIETISEYAFENCSNIEEVITPAHVVLSLPKESLRSVIITSGEKIEDSSFEKASKLTSIKLSNTITEIGIRAFSDCVSLKEISLSESINSIGGSAFSGCVNLEIINIPNNISIISSAVFSNCKKIKEITIPNNVTCIETNAFKGCESLEEIDIPDSVTTIESGAFDDCTNLSKVKIGKGLSFETYHDSFDGADNIVEASIPSFAIRDFTKKSLRKVEISYGEDIHKLGFAGCINLEEIILSDSIIDIPENVFIDTAYYKNEDNWENDVLYIGKHLIKAKATISGTYEIKSGTIFIASKAFDNCEALTGLIIPDSIKNIGKDAFFESKNIEEVVGPSFALDYIHKDSVVNVIVTSGAKISDFAFQDSLTLTKISLPETITHIGKSAFSGCMNLTNIKLPDSLMIISDDAFNNCSSINELTLPSNLISIGKGAFSGVKIKNIIIPDKVETIGEYAFSYCKYLETVTWEQKF